MCLRVLERSERVEVNASSNSTSASMALLSATFINSCRMLEGETAWEGGEEEEEEGGGVGKEGFDA